jgi:biotin synthesis protein BioG
MQFQWLNQDHSKDVIVVFGGWALGSEPFEHLAGNQDVLFVDDFRDIEVLLPDLAEYDTRTAVAYSFGVAAFGHWQALHKVSFDRQIAINGSLSPVDRRLGIPPAVFEATVAHMSPAQFEAFVVNCYGEKTPAPQVDLEARIAELYSVAERGAAPATHFDVIWASTQDRIFPIGNLRRAWARQSDRLREMDASHVPFGQWQSWQEIVT